MASELFGLLVTFFLLFTSSPAQVMSKEGVEERKGGVVGRGMEELSATGISIQGSSPWTTCSSTSIFIPHPQFHYHCCTRSIIQVLSTSYVLPPPRYIYRLLTYSLHHQQPVHNVHHTSTLYHDTNSTNRHTIFIHVLHL